MPDGAQSLKSHTRHRFVVGLVGLAAGGTAISESLIFCSLFFSNYCFFGPFRREMSHSINVKALSFGGSVGYDNEPTWRLYKMENGLPENLGKVLGSK